MARLKITLYIDTISPDLVFKSVDVTYVPVFLSGLINKVSPLTPNIARIKLTMYIINTERLQIPPNFPPLTLHVIRTLCALEHSDAQFSTPKQERLVRALNHLFTRYWVNKVLTYQLKVLKAELTKIFKPVGPIKKKLIENINLAFSEGAFGLP
ncbi:HCCA isomerase/glutathione S-transferase kappa [Diplogelasinospora grovesii]|uniref:HCCA isomerase/glutathione S-transferase kappa n=1 Tax=Diplogelasinospora grovesii TaxID=303347 RepID=A0AAN6S5P5_9PEZI|nr:HCCA isomerase/glutathione S-transferase kappa [Diplogelasinospora grovesii]